MYPKISIFVFSIYTIISMLIGKMVHLHYYLNTKNVNFFEKVDLNIQKLDQNGQFDAFRKKTDNFIHIPKKYMGVQMG